MKNINIWIGISIGLIASHIFLLYNYYLIERKLEEQSPIAPRPYPTVCIGSACFLGDRFSIQGLEVDVRAAGDVTEVHLKEGSISIMDSTHHLTIITK